MTMIRRHEFTSTLSLFTSTLVNTLKDALDPYWDTVHTAETTYANWGNALLTNKKYIHAIYHVCDCTRQGRQYSLGTEEPGKQCGITRSIRQSTSGHR